MSGLFSNPIITKVIRLGGGEVPVSFSQACKLLKFRSRLIFSVCVPQQVLSTDTSVCASVCQCIHCVLLLCACLPVAFGTPVTYSSTWGLSPRLFRLSALLVPFFKVCFVPYANKACLCLHQSILSLPFFPVSKAAICSV